MSKAFILILLSALCVQIALAAQDYCIQLVNSNGSKAQLLCSSPGTRICGCLKNTQTGSIQGVNGGDIKLFSKSDCTGNYQKLGSHSKIRNAQWVNSFSMGASESGKVAIGCLVMLLVEKAVHLEDVVYKDLAEHQLARCAEA
ncbi:hypothetical protein BGZ50_006743 [Haplosporangium sp. Z 11]|nr:hypothetical protein BGZ50_006743 [Haplosporangium sp. Z 11]